MTFYYITIIIDSHWLGDCLKTEWQSVSSENATNAYVGMFTIIALFYLVSMKMVCDVVAGLVSSETNFVNNILHLEEWS